MISVGILVFPNVEELDFVGPFEVLSYVNKIQPASTKVCLVAETRGPIRAFNGLKFIPDYTLTTCLRLDVLIIPGGQGRHVAMHNPHIKDFILQQAQQAKYLASVCTGAFLLA